MCGRMVFACFSQHYITTVDDLMMSSEFAVVEFVVGVVLIPSFVLAGGQRHEVRRFCQWDGGEGGRKVGDILIQVITGGIGVGFCDLDVLNHIRGQNQSLMR